MVCKEDLRIVFFGTSDFGVPTLDSLIDNGFNVVGVVTKPDFFNKRKKQTEFTPVKEAALKHSLPILQPTDLNNEEFISGLKALDGNIFIVIAYQMIPKEVFTIPAFGTFNIHASLLPDYRGAAPINWAIANGEERIGLTSFFINEKMDDGEIIYQMSLPNYTNKNFRFMYTALSTSLCCCVCTETLRLIMESDGKPPTTKQDLSKYKHKAPKLTRENTRLDFTKDIHEIFNHIKAFSDKPGAWCTIKSNDKYNGRAIKLIKCELISFGDRTNTNAGKFVISEDGDVLLFVSNGCLKVRLLQIEGGIVMGRKDFSNGFGNMIGNWEIV